MHDMMSKLLDMARIDSGQQHISKSWQSIEELVGAPSGTRMCPPGVMS